jgi:DNA polymerase I-like protein with 3'-5' exonuclease and polymerase domains
MRAALNHEIQSTGADLTKDLQYELWGLQPVGVGEWEILTLNVHDEIVAPALPKHTKRCEEIVENFCARNRYLVPFLAMTWSSNLPDWSDK